MEEYDFEVEHKPGVRHSNADTISRLPCRGKSCSVRLCYKYSSGSIQFCCIRVGYYRRKRLACRGMVNGWIASCSRERPRHIMHFENHERKGSETPWDAVALPSHDVRILRNMWPRLRIRNGILQRGFESLDGSAVNCQIVLPATLRKELLGVIHEGMTGGHLARKRTAACVQARTYSPTWSSDLDQFLKECQPCARYHRGGPPKKAGICTPLVDQPWIRVSVGITGPHPRSSRSNQYILTLVDHFSKWSEAIPLRNHTAPTVARALMTHVFYKFGALLQLLTDQGPEFESQLFQELMRWMEIDKLRTMSFHPSCNGVVEKFHRTLNYMLGKAVSES